MANLKIGTIGLGRLGYHHTKNVTRTFGAELVAVADAFPDALKRGETDFGVKGYADYHDLINDPEVEAIVIATPTQTHYEVLMAAIPSGKPMQDRLAVPLNDSSFIILLNLNTFLV